MRRSGRAALVGAAIAALVTLPGLGVGTLWDNSETAYGEVAREILLTHDWVVMHWNGAPWFIQPPLYFWCAALCMLVFGVGSFALRLPAALATIAMGALVGRSVARYAGERAGIYTALILSTSLMQAVIGRLAIMDALLDLFVAATIFAWARALESGRSRDVVVGALAAAFGFLAKGPVAPVVALLVLVPYAWWQARCGRLRMPRAAAWGWGALAFALVALPWIALLVARIGMHGIAVLIGHYTIGRYTGVIENQSGPVWYYVPVVILGFFPWIAFLPSAVAASVAAVRDADAGDDVRALIRLAWLWAVVPLLFFSFARTKLPNYIALEFPSLAILVAWYFEQAARRGARRSALYSASIVPLAIAAVAIAVALFARDNRLTGDVLVVSRDLAIAGAVTGAGALLTAAALTRRPWAPLAPYPLAIAAALAMDVLALVALPRVERFKPIPVLAARIDASLLPSDAVAIRGVAGANGLLFYTRPPVFELAAPGTQPHDGAVPMRSVICSAPRVWVVAPARRSSQPTYGRTRVEITRDGTAALYLYEGPPCVR
jgi:4-amino-4-deoxy-L-arabinose transferase-like glycosyltransferase